MNRDFVEMLSGLNEAEVDFLVVGAYALAAHGVPRATGDLDIWVRAASDNASRVLAALGAFGAPLFDLTLEDLTKPGTVFQIGVAPSRIDILTSVTGLEFDSARDRCVLAAIEGLRVPVLGRQDFITNKRALGRPKDIADIALLEEARPSH